MITTADQIHCILASVNAYGGRGEKMIGDGEILGLTSYPRYEGIKILTLPQLTTNSEVIISAAQIEMVKADLEKLS